MCVFFCKPGLDLDFGPDTWGRFVGWNRKDASEAEITEKKV